MSSETLIGYATACQEWSSLPEMDTKVIQTCNISAVMDINDSELANLSLPQCKKLLTSFLHFDDTLTTSQVQLLTAQIVAYHDIFALQEHDRGKVDNVMHSININDHSPIHQPPRQISFAQRKEMLKLVNDILQHNIIERSSSPWSSPVVLVKKKDGQLQFCVDYRRINAITLKDVFPMPCIDDMLDQLSGKKVYSTLNGYQWKRPHAAKPHLIHVMGYISFVWCHSAYVTRLLLFSE